MKTGKNILAFLAAFSAGIGVGILFAPKKGSALRDDIRNQKDNYLNRAQGTVDCFKSSIDEKIDALKRKRRERFVDSDSEEKIEEAESEIEKLKDKKV